MATVPTPKRGEVWLVRFDPSAGAEIRKGASGVRPEWRFLSKRPTIPFVQCAAGNGPAFPGVGLDLHFRGG